MWGRVDVSSVVVVVENGLFAVSGAGGSVVKLCRGCCVFCAFCLSCDACSLRCWLRGRVFVSSWRCCVFVSRVHPVAVRSAVFWIF